METERLLDVALFAHKSDNQPRQRHVDWPSLARVLTEHEERSNKDGRLWSPTLYKPETKRAKQNVVSVSALVLDFDKGDNPEAFTWGWDRWAYVMHTTHSHTLEAPRWRVVFPLVASVAAVEWPAVWTALAHRFGGNEVDPSCKDASRIYYLPSCLPTAPRLVHENAGDWLDAGEFLRPSVDLLVERARGELPKGRNNAGMWLACQMRDNGYSQSEAERADWHTQVATEKQRPDGKVDRYTEHEWRETVRKVYGTPARPGWTALRNGANGTGAIGAECTEATAGWEPPLPFGAFDLPSFPMHVLPDWLQDMAAGVATLLQVPVDATALFSLAVLAVACQKRVEAVIRPGWREPLSLWALIVLEPANRKSGLFRELLQPISDYEFRLKELTKPERAAAEAARRIAEGRLKRLEDEAIKGKTEFQRFEAEREALELAAQVEKLPVVAEPRLMVNDATPEKLGMLLGANNSRMALLSPEGDAFEMMAGRYSNGMSNLGLYLAGHSGDDYSFDRVNRDTVFITRAALTLGMTVQPQVLAGFASKPQFRGRGLLGRMLYCMADSLLGYRESLTPPVSTAVHERYSNCLTRLLEMPAMMTPEGRPVPHDLTFDDDANQEMVSIQDWLEPQLGPWGELRQMSDWAGKLAGQTARIASLIRLGQLAETGKPWSVPVDGETVRGARSVAEYLIPHAQAAYQRMGADATREGALHIIRWLQKNPCSRFTRRNLHRRLIGTFDKAEDLDASLAVLLERGYLRQAAPPEGQRGPKAVIFDVHPSLSLGAGELDDGR